ncbi:MAG: Succinate dehydrogenase flavoprotein subunit, partial [Bacteroidetes bacterium 38_7]
YPAIHYTMGGIWVDYELMTTIPGLFAIGEANFSDHGANRLGASSLLQGCTDGYFILPYTISDYLADKISIKPLSLDDPEFQKTEKEVMDRIERLMNIKGKTTPLTFHKELGKIMWNYAGMVRNEQGLKQGLKEVSELEEQFYKDLKITGSKHDINQTLERALRVADSFEIARLILHDALNRKESCGAHFREEYQTEDGEPLRNDEEFMYVAAWEYTGEDKEPILHKEELKYEFVKPTQRSYK